MARPISVDATDITVDSTGITTDAGYSGVIRQNWPCAGLASDPPSVADRQAVADADAIYPQIAGVLTPRGPAWGTDEAGSGQGAQPVMSRVWRALAAWVADLNRRDWLLATQVFPSAIEPDLSLPDWEAELGLPDACITGSDASEARIAAVRARFGARGGSSPAYFICLAASIGYEISIEEPTQFLVDVSELGPDPIEEGWFLIDESELAPDSIVDGQLQPEGDGDPLESFAMVPVDPVTFDALEEVSDTSCWVDWIVHVASTGETWFRIDEGELANDSIVRGQLQPEGPGDPLEGFLPASDLECLLRRVSPQHTRLTFSYALD